MYKIMLSLLLVTFMACNSKNPKVAKESTSENAAKQPVSWTRDAEMHWMDECVEGSKNKLGEEKAFNQCKCILRQIQEKNPTNDSLKNMEIISDTALVTTMAQHCETAK
jgi:hypothetical protein